MAARRPAFPVSLSCLQPAVFPSPLAPVSGGVRSCTLPYRADAPTCFYPRARTDRHAGPLALLVVHLGGAGSLLGRVRPEKFRGRLPSITFGIAALVPESRLTSIFCFLPMGDGAGVSAAGAVGRVAVVTRGIGLYRGFAIARC